MACVPVLGRLKTAAVFPLDECMRPIYGTGVGWVDDCFAALGTSDNMDEGESFTRRCADGTIMYYDAGEQSLQDVEVTLDLNGEPSDDWLDLVGLVQPVMSGGTNIGYTRCTKSSANLLVAVWQEVLGADACDGDELEGGNWRVHLYPLRRARLTFEGNLGAEDSYVRITGRTSAEANLGAGPIPLLAGGGGEPIFPLNDLIVCHHTVLKNGVAAPPEECGAIDTTSPAPTGVTPGEPGSFLPNGSTPPADLVALNALGPLGQTVAWGQDDYVVLGDASLATWDGNEWVVFT